MIGILRCDPPLRTKPIRIDFPPNTSPVKKPRIRPRKRLAGTKTGQNRFRSPAPISPKALLRAFSVSDPDTMAGASDNANRKLSPAPHQHVAFATREEVELEAGAAKRLPQHLLDESDLQLAPQT